MNPEVFFRDYRHVPSLIKTQHHQTRRFELPVSNLPKSVKIIALVFWLSLVAGFWLYARQQDTSLVVQLADLIDALQQGWLGPVVLFVVYMVRPFVLAPVTFLTLLAGFLYGALGGYTLAMVALLASAMVVYGVGMLASHSAYRLSKRPMIAKLRDNSFETVLISRLLFIPGDITNYLCGIIAGRYESLFVGVPDWRHARGVNGDFGGRVH